MWATLLIYLQPQNSHAICRKKDVCIQCLCVWFLFMIWNCFSDGLCWRNNQANLPDGVDTYTYFSVQTETFHFFLSHRSAALLKLGSYLKRSPLPPCALFASPYLFLCSVHLLFFLFFFFVSCTAHQEELPLFFPPPVIMLRDGFNTSLCEQPDVLTLISINVWYVKMSYSYK